MQLDEQLRRLITPGVCASDSLRNRALAKLDSGRIIQAQDPREHFCVVFLTMDLYSRRLLVARHRHTGTWLFTGGHIEPGESPIQTLNREVQEELGLPPQFSETALPFLVTLTDGIRNLGRECTTHYEVWFLLEADRGKVNVGSEEFHESRWVDLDAAQDLIRDPEGIAALGRVAGLLQT